MKTARQLEKYLQDRQTDRQKKLTDRKRKTNSHSESQPARKTSTRQIEKDQLTFRQPDN